MYLPSPIIIYKYITWGPYKRKIVKQFCLVMIIIGDGNQIEIKRRTAIYLNHGQLDKGESISAVSAEDRTELGCQPTN